MQHALYLMPLADILKENQMAKPEPTYNLLAGGRQARQ